MEDFRGNLVLKCLDLFLKMASRHSVSWGAALKSGERKNE